MEEETWISLHRKFKDWEWYKDINTKTLFLHLLLVANYKDNYWKGILVKRGQRLTSLEHLSDETGLTVQQIRTSIKRLKSTGEITSEATSKYSLITIVKYSFYQRNIEEVTSKVTSDITNEQQANNKQVTTNNNDNNIYLYFINKYKSNEKRNFSETMKTIRAIREDENWDVLTADQQNKIIAEI